MLVSAVAADVATRAGAAEAEAEALVENDAASAAAISPSDLVSGVASLPPHSMRARASQSSRLVEGAGGAGNSGASLCLNAAADGGDDDDDDDDDGSSAGG